MGKNKPAKNAIPPNPNQAPAANSDVSSLSY